MDLHAVSATLRAPAIGSAQTYGGTVSQGLQGYTLQEISALLRSCAFIFALGASFPEGPTLCFKPVCAQRCTVSAQLD